jgi:hypothetical protein
MQRTGSFSGPNAGVVGGVPDAVRATFDASGQQLSVAYGDRSLVIWDVHDLQKVGVNTYRCHQIYVCM